jgi:hypothetical protein
MWLALAILFFSSTGRFNAESIFMRSQPPKQVGLAQAGYAESYVP